jgi:hypothetical protein
VNTGNNDHSHFFIYLLLWFCFMSNCTQETDISSVKRNIRDLESDVNCVQSLANSNASELSTHQSYQQKVNGDLADQCALLNVKVAMLGDEVVKQHNQQASFDKRLKKLEETVLPQEPKKLVPKSTAKPVQKKEAVKQLEK